MRPRFVLSRRAVALKVIRPGLVTLELLRRFERETQALGRLHHSGIAQIHEAGLSASPAFRPKTGGRWHRREAGW